MLPPQFECPVCLESSSHDIVTLACNFDTPNVDVCHSFCKRCIIIHMQQRACPSCPMCNNKFSKVDLEAIKSYVGKELIIQSTFEQVSDEELDELDDATHEEQVQRLRERVIQLEDALENTRQRIANLVQLRDALPDNRVDRSDITRRITSLYVRADTINTRLDNIQSDLRVMTRVIM